MIRNFEQGDQHKYKANRFSDAGDVDFVFVDEAYEKYTLEEDGEVKCILCWTEYSPRKFAIFFLMPEGTQFRHARQLKKFLQDATDRLKPESCMTYSEDCDVLNRWHLFFGFTKEPQQVMIENKTFNKWVITWE